MTDEHKIPDILKNEDIIYHYCKFDTAMFYILQKGELKFSERHKSIDPIESTKPFPYHSGSSLNFEERKKIEIFIEEYNKNIKQLCFCGNDKRENYEGQMTLPYEYYGFLKPRMWDQYADNYKGVCLAFSLEGLKKCVAGKPIISDNISYEKYNILELNHVSINDNNLKDTGFDFYTKNYIKRLEKIIFRKHIDYMGENEYRFCSFLESEYVYIDISKCLKGIVISRTDISQHFDVEINKMAEKYNAELLYVKWNENGIKIRTKKEKDDVMNIIMKNIQSI